MGKGYKRRGYSKYHAKKTVVDGITFASLKEARRYIDLKNLQKAGVISDLKLQVPYELIPQYREPDTIGPRGGVKKGRVIESACYYVADFVYVDEETGKKVVEDCKGMRTRAYRIKRKLMYDRFGIRIKET